MSAIGRIIIVLNLLLAAAFMGYASNLLSSTKDYKAEIAQLKTDNDAALAAKDDAISALEATAKTLSDEARDFREARDANMSKADALASRLEEEKRRGDGQSTELTKVVSAMGDLNSTIKSLTSAKDDAVQARHEAESARDEAEAKALAIELAMRDASDASEAADAENEMLSEKVAALESKLSAKDAQLQQMGRITGISPSAVMAQPQVEGAVVSIAADLSPALVMLNVGSSDDVRRGMTFDIFSNGVFKGQCRVEQVDERVCSAVVTRMQAGRSISPGDTASTKIH